jgi:hypothetical protein
MMKSKAELPAAGALTEIFSFSGDFMSGTKPFLRHLAPANAVKILPYPAGFIQERSSIWPRSVRLSLA